MTKTKELPKLDWRLAPHGHFLAMALPPGAAVLDVGCGDGVLGEWLTAKNPEIKYTGVDAEDQEIPAGDFYKATLPELEGMIGGYDAVICMGTLWEVEDLGAALTRLAELCRKFLILEFIVRAEHLNTGGYRTNHTSGDRKSKVYIKSGDEVQALIHEHVLPMFQLKAWDATPMSAEAAGLPKALDIASLQMVFNALPNKSRIIQ